MPIPLFEPPTLDHRRFCECCGYPTLFVPDGVGSEPAWDLSAESCDLCEWENCSIDENGEPVPVAEGTANDGLTIAQARVNFARFFSIYDPADLPDWKLAAPSPSVVSARKVLRPGYESLLAATPDTLWQAWVAVADAEESLRGALAAQQAADEEVLSAADFDE